MIITKNNLIKIALNLQKKQTLLKNEKVFLKFFSIIKFLIINGEHINLNNINLSIIKKLKVIKKALLIKKLTAEEYYTNNFCYNVFCGDIKNVVLSKSGYIKIFENNNYKFLNLLISGHSIFANSRVNNFPNKTIVFNKHFTLKIFIDSNKLVFSCNKLIDNFASNSFYIILGNTPVLALSKYGLAAANIMLLNTCKQVKYAREAKLNALNSILMYGYYISSQKSLQNYINLASICCILNFLEKPISVCPLSSASYINEVAPMQNVSVLNNINCANKVIEQSTFFMHFVNGVFYANSLFSEAVFKMPLMLGNYKIVFTTSGIKIINLTQNHVVYISTECKIKSAQILNGELVCVLKGNIKFCISNLPAKWQEFAAPTLSTLIKLERIFLNNIVKTLFALRYSFYELVEVSDTFYMQLKQIIKNKQSLRYASKILIKLANTARDEAELKKLFKLSGLISSLPERKTNLTDLILRQNIELSELEKLSTEEQLELYKIKQQNLLVKKVKIC